MSLIWPNTFTSQAGITNPTDADLRAALDATMFGTSNSFSVWNDSSDDTSVWTAASWREETGVWTGFGVGAILEPRIVDSPTPSINMRMQMRNVPAEEGGPTAAFTDYQITVTNYGDLYEAYQGSLGEVYDFPIEVEYPFTTAHFQRWLDHGASVLIGRLITDGEGNVTMPDVPDGDYGMLLYEVWIPEGTLEPGGGIGGALEGSRARFSHGKRVSA